MPNSEHSVSRRLVAIVVADVVGYTRLMERDEAGTHARLKEIRAQVGLDR
jgi:adenylate cyclase